MRKILIVEDDHRLSESISLHLTKEGYLCECAYDGQMAMKYFSKDTFHLVVLDINLPKINGLDLCRNLREKDARVPILMITAFGDIESKMEAFDYGADDYLVKPFHLKELTAKVRVFLKRAEQNIALQEAYAFIDLIIDPNKKTVIREGKEIHLTPKEYSLLEYLVKNKNRIVSKDELARNVWDINYGVTPNTIEVYINFLRNKIDRGFEHKFILTKPGFGYYISSQTS
ncbi:response regulator transcription factor [Chryseosolibacter indicus]|uniref:Response regulator transcription factor n=1 Tax=Chryseosolibacter indicus TaxID=2782351 RepID=A0ABS5VKB6_9BACT|nr:response regulator transcription factor [Chryseosolibacter indicus]MBT1701889.1 response regulator transcription factor [Chryseosolibacter indicus]